eukprot:scaffold250979_cov16-Tisochrysis_lutea.AAC.1
MQAWRMSRDAPTDGMSTMHLGAGHATWATEEERQMPQENVTLSTVKYYHLPKSASFATLPPG